MSKKGCAVRGCKKPHRARGYCQSHYSSKWYSKQPDNPCSEVGCEKSIHARDLCEMHYRHWLLAQRTDICSEVDCDKVMYAKGLCSLHYDRVRLTGSTTLTVRDRTQFACRITDCDKPVYAKELCNSHYDRQRKYGDPLVVLAERQVGNCRLEGCGQKAKTKGWCKRHYATHGQPHYVRWFNMMKRCYDTQNKDYYNYGGRGIKVHKKWHKYPAFRDYLDNVLGQPAEGHTLDRIDPDGNYEPGNVRWASARKQRHNRRDTATVPLVTDGDTWGDPDSFHQCSVCKTMFRSISAFDRHQCELPEVES